MLDDEIRTAIESSAAVTDFAPMQERLPRSVAGGDPLLMWLADRNFVFLGRVYLRTSVRLVVDPTSCSASTDRAAGCRPGRAAVIRR